MPADEGARMDDTCPRCGAAFHCGAHDTEPCPCGTLHLDAAVLQALRARYAGCLCRECLRQLQNCSGSTIPRSRQILRAR